MDPTMLMALRRRRMASAFRGKVSDVTAPTLSSPTDTASGTTTAALGVTTNEGNGTLYWVVSMSATPPSAAQVKAGNDHTGSAAADSGLQAVSGTGVQSISGGATGLSAGTTYYAHFMHEDAATIQSSVSTADGFTTDTIPAVLSAPLALPLGDTSGYVGVTTDIGAGTLYWVLTTSATPPSAAQVKAGQDHTGSAAAAADDQSVSGSGAQSATATGLSSNTAYYAYFVQDNGADSNVAAAAVFTTLTTGTSDTDFDNLVAAMSVAPNNLRKGYIARFIGALYAASVWSKIDAMWVLAAHDEQAGRLNWKSPGSFTLTAVNSPTFTTDRGFAGNGSSSYLDTGWDRGMNGVQFTQNDAHISVYQRTNGNNNVESFADFQAGPRIAIGARPVSTTGGGTLVNSATRVTGPASGTLPIQAIGRRNNSTQASLVRDGVEVTAPTSSNSGSPGTVDLAFGRGGSYTSAEVAGGSVGAYLDDTGAAAFFAAWHDYMVALGADT